MDIPGSLPEGRGPLSGGLLLSSVLDCFSLSGEQWQAHPLHPLSVLRGLRQPGGEEEQAFSLLHPRFRLLFVLVAFHFSPLWTNGAALRSMNSIDAILEDKGLRMTHLDLQKTFPDIPCVSQMLGGPSLRLGDTKECLNIPSGIG